MNEKTRKFSSVAGAVVALFALVGLTAIASTTISTVITTGGITIGSSGTAMTQVLKGTCNLLGMDASQAATTSAVYDCAVSNVTSGDLVVAQLSTTTQNTTIVGNWVIESAKASSTAGYITVRVANYTGGAATPSVTAVGSSTQYIIIR